MACAGGIAPTATALASDCRQQVVLGSLGSLAYGGAPPQGLLVELFQQLRSRLNCQFEVQVLSLPMLRRAWQNRRRGEGPQWVAPVSARFNTPRLLFLRMPMVLLQPVEAGARALKELLGDPGSVFIQLDGASLGPPHDAVLARLPSARRMKAVDADSLLRLLAAGRAQASLMPLLLVEPRLQALKLDGRLSLLTLPTPPHVPGQPHFEATGIAFDPALLPPDAPARLGEALRALRADGTLQSLFEQHLGKPWAAECLLSAGLTGMLEFPQQPRPGS